MPIKGLTHQQPQFPQIGQLRKGIFDKEENRARDLDYFRFTSDIPEVVEAFGEVYGDQPRLINVYLPHKTTDENWEGWMEEYVASGLIHRCDGEYVVRYRDRQTGKYVDPVPNTVECPYESGERERTKETPGCKPQGRLQVVIRELKRFAYVMVITTSWNDIKHLDEQLRALEEIHGDLRGIPLQLRRAPERISTPQMKKERGEWVRTAERQRRESWLLSIEAAPEWADMRMEAQRLEALPELPKLEAGVIEAEITPVPHEPAPEPEEIPEPKEELTEPKEEPMTLGQALGIVLTRPAPKLGVVEGDYLLTVVKKDGKDLVEYLSKTSNYAHMTTENIELQRAATVILENWDKARKVVLKEDVGEQDVVVEGDTPPLF